MSRHSKKIPKIINVGPKPVRLAWKGSQRAQAEHEKALRRHPPQRKKQPKKKLKAKKKRQQQPDFKKPGFYQEYLQSKWWKNRRKQALQRAGYCCERCGASGKLEVHHRTYDRLGKEKDADLEVICPDCHDYRHAEQRAMDAHLSSIIHFRD